MGGKSRMYLVKVVDCVALRAQVGAWDAGNRLTRLLVAEVAANSAPQQWHGGRLAMCRVLQCAGAGAGASASSGVSWAGDTGTQGHFCHRPGWCGWEPQCGHGPRKFWASRSCWSTCIAINLRPRRSCPPIPPAAHRPSAIGSVQHRRRLLRSLTVAPRPIACRPSMAR